MEQRIRREGDTATGIDDLPSAVLDAIVGNLTLSEAVRVSTVAKSWRNCWKMLPVLEFNENFYAEFIEGTTNLLDALVNSILSRHIGTLILFELRLPHCFPVGVPIDITQGIRVLSQKEVQSVTINVANRDRPYLELPDEVYECSTLEHLSLQHCEFGNAPADFDGFHELNWLTLSDVLVDDNVIDLMISRAQYLHRIEMEFFEDGDPMEIRHADRCYLDTLSYKCKFESVKSLRLTAFPGLIKATFETVLELPGRPLRMPKVEYFARLIPRVEELWLGGSALASLADQAVPVRLVRQLQYVNELHFYLMDIGSADQLSVAFCLMRSCPHLETLTITLDQDDADHDAALAILDAQRGSNPLPSVSNLSFNNLTAIFPIEAEFIETVSGLCPQVNNIRVWRADCLDDEDHERIHEELLDIRLPEGAHFMIDWNGEVELLT